MLMADALGADRPGVFCLTHLGKPSLFRLLRLLDTTFTIAGPRGAFKTGFDFGVLVPVGSSPVSSLPFSQVLMLNVIPAFSAISCYFGM